jgi:hypothetical protein
MSFGILVIGALVLGGLGHKIQSEKRKKKKVPVKKDH